MYRTYQPQPSTARRTPLLRLLWAALTLRLFWISIQRRREWIWVRIVADMGGYIEHMRMWRWRAQRLRAKWKREERAKWIRRWRQERWRNSQ